jgi:hypothetical protein
MMEDQVLTRYREEVGGEEGSLSPRTLSNNETAGESDGAEQQPQDAGEV